MISRSALHRNSNLNILQFSNLIWFSHINMHIWKKFNRFGRMIGEFKIIHTGWHMYGRNHRPLPVYTLNLCHHTAVANGKERAPPVMSGRNTGNKGQTRQSSSLPYDLNIERAGNSACFITDSLLYEQRQWAPEPTVCLFHTLYYVHETKDHRRRGVTEAATTSRRRFSLWKWKRSLRLHKPYPFCKHRRSKMQTAKWEQGETNLEE